MSSGAEFVGYDGQKPATLPERTSFSQKCSLLSQYLKEKGSFGDLSLGMTCNLEPINGHGMPDMLRDAATTMNLFPVTEKAYDVHTRSMGSLRSVRPMDLFPQQAGFASLAAVKEDVQKNIDPSVNKSATSESQTAQMTIFYAGQVIVFDDFPADKAKQVMALASKGSSQSHTALPPTPAKSYPAFASNVAKTPSESSISVPPSPNPIPSFGNSLVQEHVQLPRQPVAGDLPIARRASLHRFLEKRKDRITAKAPYQTSSPPVGLSKPAESNSWLGLASQSQH